MAEPSYPEPKVGGSISRLISVAVLVVVIAAIGVLFYRVMVGFFVPLFLAALLVVIFRPLHGWFERRLGHRRRLSAGLTTSAILLIVLIPFALIITVAAAQSTRLLSNVNSQTLTLALVRARQASGLAIRSPETFEEIKVLVEQLSDPNDERRTRARIATLERRLDHLAALHADAGPEARERFAAIDELLDELRADLRALHAVPDQSAVDTADDAATAEAGDSTQPGVHAPEPPVTQSDKADLDDAEGLAESSRGPALRAYQATLVQVHESTESLLTYLLGGTVTSQLKWIANPTEEDIKHRLEQIRLYVQRNVPNVASTTTEYLFRMIFGLVVLIIAVYFFLIDGPTMIRTLMHLSPLDDHYEERLLSQFDQTSRAVVLATILSALAQGVLATVGYYVAGLDSVALLFLATTFMALIPFFGALSVWLPCALWLGFVDQRWTAAIALAIYGAAIVSTIDNVIKVFILHGRSQLHPLLALLSVLGGVQVFGPIGLLVGPMIVVFLQTLLEILNQELARADAEQDAGPAKPETS